MPRSLISDWKRVATSGKTVDGRTIEPEDLRDMATSYDPATYTAVIWCEHQRYMGNYGTVSELKAESADNGKVALFAKLQPNERLLQINKEAQKLFTSIEIKPNFADSGKPYLAGLAITDQPASLGTEALHFSRRASSGNHFGSLEPLGDLTLVDADEPVLSFFTRLFSQLGFKDGLAPVAALATLPTPAQENDLMDPKTAEAFAAAVDKLGTVATSLESSAATFAVQQPATVVIAAPLATEPAIEPAAGGITAEQFNTLKGSLDKLTENFNTALNQGKGQTVPNTTGAVTDEPEQVY